MALALELLTALAEEGSALERKRHTAVMPILVRRSAEVLALVSGALSGKLGEHFLSEAHAAAAVGTRMVLHATSRLRYCEPYILEKEIPCFTKASRCMR